MECLYLHEMLSVGDYAELNRVEAKHARALRLRAGDGVMLTNGIGFVYTAIIETFDKEKLVVKVKEILPNYGETKHHLHLFMGLIEHRDRLEFCVEKAIECGVSEITLFKSAYSSQKVPNVKRLESKAIATIKQCKRANLPKINLFSNIKNFDNSAVKFENILLANFSGNKFAGLSLGNNIALFVGPEGGFNEQELEFIRSFEQTKVINIGERRLRAETAAIAMCVLCANI